MKRRLFIQKMALISGGVLIGGTLLSDVSSKSERNKKANHKTNRGVFSHNLGVNFYPNY